MPIRNHPAITGYQEHMDLADMKKVTNPLEILHDPFALSVLRNDIRFRINNFLGVIYEVTGSETLIKSITKFNGDSVGVVFREVLWELALGSRSAAEKAMLLYENFSQGKPLNQFKFTPYEITRAYLSERISGGLDQDGMGRYKSDHPHQTFVEVQGLLGVTQATVGGLPLLEFEAQVKKAPVASASAFWANELSKLVPMSAAEDEEQAAAKAAEEAAGSGKVFSFEDAMIARAALARQQQRQRTGTNG